MNEKSRVFVFGSNLAGRHGKGAALHALKYYGAIPNQGIGHHGNSYAIPTKDRLLRTLPQEEVVRHIGDFSIYVINRLDLNFNVTQVGCGLAGFQSCDIAPAFFHICQLRNLWFDPYWKPWLPGAQFWDGPL